jgi:hydrogenase maturation protease
MPVTRLLALGNDILADDAFGIRVAGEARRVFGDCLDVAESSEAGMALLDHVQNCDRLVVVDTVMTGQAAPGTITTLRNEEFRVVPGGSPHYVGLFEAIQLAGKLGLQVPKEVIIIVVEAADTLTVGGPMTPAVEAAMPKVLELIRHLLTPGQYPQFPIPAPTVRSGEIGN